MAAGDDGGGVENAPAAISTERPISGAFDSGLLSEVKDDADRCPHDAPMMPPAIAGEDSDALIPDFDDILREAWDKSDEYAPTGWRRESMGERVVKGVLVKRFRWRQGARGNRRTYTEKGYVVFDNLSDTEKAKHERNRDKYTTKRAKGHRAEIDT